ncbi:MAG: SAM-dependent methyltransferase [Cyclobacteriaceae bacterium]
MENGKLYLIPTIISDNTQQVIIPEAVTKVISDVDYYLVENVRTARRFISSLKLDVEIESLRFEVLDKKTSGQSLIALMAPIHDGKDVGVMSESGCPGVADPGALAVEYAHKNRIQVVPLVGPSSIIMTLMASGFNGQSFTFHGYLPIDKAERKRRIKKMEEDATKLDQTQIFMDTPYRNGQLFEDLIANCSPSTRLCIARDITGQNELIQTKSINEWKSAKKLGLHKIPVMFALYH